MKVFSSTSRIVLGLVSLSVSSLLVAGLIGLVPNPTDAARRSRIAFCESTAVSFTALAPRMNAEQIQQTLEILTGRHPDVECLAIRDAEGQLVVQVGNHLKRWKSQSGTAPHSDGNEMIVPIMAENAPWGQLEVRFHPMSAGPWGLPIRADIALALFMAVGLSFSFYLYLRKVLSHLNPSSVVPPRVREALDALAEGLLVLDLQQRVVLANSAFEHCSGVSAESIVGHSASQLGFSMAGENSLAPIPWAVTASTGETVRGLLMKLMLGELEKTFSVSTVPIHDDRRRCRGVVVSFEDVTELDRKQSELREALTSLKQSSEEIRQQNRELEWLATRDALTGCMNRRSFFRIFDEEWAARKATKSALCAVMVDIDHFKSINDNYGHAKGDEVLKKVALTIIQTVSEDDIVCRYGGEEFSVLMLGRNLDDAELQAERIRVAIMGLRLGELQVTASLGVSSVTQHAQSPQDLLDQADKCLYVAKRNGRNQVVRFDKAADQIERLGDHAAPIQRSSARKHSRNDIPFQAVTALVTAMSYRDHRTAAHSRRVADLCVITAEGLLSMRECYTLEIAALLHDIGKIGIPDNILHKSGRLTDNEWDIMKRHSSVSVELVKASFGSDVLAEIIENRRVWFDLSNAPRTIPEGSRTSISARILAIADAYDSMISDAVYRGCRSAKEAFAELRRCAGTQFDPELVSRFISSANMHHQQEAMMPEISVDTALDIGLQIEQLVAALDDQNLEDLKELTTKLQSSAERSGIHHMADVSRQLKQALAEKSDMIEVMQVANELLDLCRLTQVSLIQGNSLEYAAR
jgi:diguanylate cyclase (GGDEF)-like protein/PAS domain S-box-containing protein